MIREFLIAGAIAGAAVGLAPVAGAQPDPNRPAYPDKPGQYSTDVPGINYDAHLAGPCDRWDREVFGRGPGGETLQCKYIPNQWPPVYTGFWVASGPLQGVQQVGSTCPNPQYVAQSPDGLPMVCLGSKGWQPGWFTGSGFYPA